MSLLNSSVEFENFHCITHSYHRNARSKIRTRKYAARTQVPRLEIWQKSFTRKYDARRAEWLNLERLKTAVLGIISEDEKELRKPRNRKLVALYVMFEREAREF